MKTCVPLAFAGSLLLLSACGRPESAPTGLASTSIEASARSAVVHRVTAGGADIIAPGVDANWSLVGFQYADGSASGKWTDQFGHGNGGFHADITCVNVVGNEAWVSGVARSGDFAGRVWVAHMRDNGRSANEPEDEISYSILTLPGAPETICKAPFPIALVPRSGGQVTID